MSFFQRVTKTVEIDAENSVEIRKLNYGERQRCMSKAMDVKARGDGQSEVSIDAALLQMETLKFGVVSWSGPGFEGRMVTPGSIEELPPAIAELLAKEVDALNESPADAEKKA